MKLAFSTLGGVRILTGRISTLWQRISASPESNCADLETIFFRSMPVRSRRKICLRLSLCWKNSIWKFPALSTGCALRFADRKEETLAEIREYISLATKLKTPYIRILGDLTAAPVDEVDDNVVLEALKALIPDAEKAGVTLLVETNGVYTNTARLRDLLNQVHSDAVGALWDVHHPYRFAGETPEQTVTNLGVYIKYTHVKDSVMENGKVSYRLMGEGDLPMDDIIRTLKSINYEGYVSLEWLKQYAPDLSDAGIVFPQFANFMHQYMGHTQDTGRLQTNRAGTGQICLAQKKC